jgi:hypothetical protein
VTPRCGSKRVKHSYAAPGTTAVSGRFSHAGELRSWNTAGLAHVESGSVDVALAGEHDCLSLECEELFSEDLVCIESPGFEYSKRQQNSRSSRAQRRGIAEWAPTSFNRVCAPIVRSIAKKR